MNAAVPAYVHAIRFEGAQPHDGARLTLLGAIIDLPVRICETDVFGDLPTDLFAEEAAAIVGAVALRRREFSAGRACARSAMAQLGIMAQALAVGADRAPVWPAGVVGSISHTRTKCAAAVAKVADGIRAIGIDIEEATALDAELLADICTPRELDWLSLQPAAERGLLAKTIFCAKECAYKCQYPLSRRLFGFDGIEIALDLPAGAFTAQFKIEATPFKPGDTLSGRLCIAEGHIATAIILT